MWRGRQKKAVLVFVWSIEVCCPRAGWEQPADLKHAARTRAVEAPAPAGLLRLAHMMFANLSASSCWLLLGRVIWAFVYLKDYGMLFSFPRASMSSWVWFLACGFFVLLVCFFVCLFILWGCFFSLSVYTIPKVLALILAFHWLLRGISNSVPWGLLW